MQKGFRIFSILLAIVLALYFTWAGAERKQPAQEIRLEIDSTFVVNSDAGKGNLVGINPYMMPIDYASGEHFFNKLDGYLQVAQVKGWLNDKTIVVFPEHIGTWLVVAGEKQGIYTADNINKALAIYVSSNFFRYLRDWFTTPDETDDKLRHSIFSSKGAPMADIYRTVFGDLAKKYGVSIVAGSLLLPNPRIDGQRIRIGMGPLYHVSAVFRPDGSMAPELIRKSFPAADERTYVVPGPVEVPVFQLPAGRTAVLIGEDAWFPETYASIQTKKAEIIAVPSYLHQRGSLGKPWAGYSGQRLPADIDSTDRGRITLASALQKYALPARIRQTNAREGMVVYLRGQLWDLETEGGFIAVSGALTSSGSCERASIVNLYLP